MLFQHTGPGWQYVTWKDVLPNKPHACRQNHPRQQWNGPFCSRMTLFAASAFHSVTAGGWQECTVHFLSLVTLTFDLDIQTRSSKGPNTSPFKFGANPFNGSRDIW